uniref:DDE-type integrase/transposase/recombinase n=1 Tax=Paraburkholderia sediminicola TaxID=458836 RepID=UPI0038BB0AFA
MTVSCARWKSLSQTIRCWCEVGEPYLLLGANDQRCAELDVLLQKRREKPAAKGFHRCMLGSCSEALRRIVTNQMFSYPATKAEIPELATVKHVFVKTCARVNKRAENSHQTTRECGRHITRSQAFLSNFDLFRQHFALTRHFLHVSLDRDNPANALLRGPLYRASPKTPSL